MPKSNKRLPENLRKNPPKTENSPLKPLENHTKPILKTLINTSPTSETPSRKETIGPSMTKKNSKTWDLSNPKKKNDPDRFEIIL